MEELFIDILNNNKETIYRICNAYAAQPEDAKDMFQEVLLNIWRALPKFENKSAVSTWVYRITLNVCLRAKHNTEKEKIKVQLEGVHLNNAHTNGEHKDYNELYNCIHQLNDADKSLMLLYLEDLPYKEIADITGMTENHIAVKIKRIRTKLLNCLNQSEYER